MGHRKKSKLEILFSGSDIAELIRRTSAPVLVYKYILDTGDIIRAPFKTPVLATDWSSASQRAAEYLLGLKNVIQTLRIIHVAGDKQLNGLSAMEVQKFRKENGRKLEEVCETFESQGIKTEPHFYIGNTTDEIEKAAQEFRASMIVMGATGKGALRERWLGSVPMELAEKSAFPTLLVPSEDKRANN